VDLENVVDGLPQPVTISKAGFDELATAAKAVRLSNNDEKLLLTRLLQAGGSIKCQVQIAWLSSYWPLLGSPQGRM
jgi:hypothetical protein